MNTAVLVPVKAFAEAKVRLAPALDGAAREDLAMTMATRVLTAAQPLPTFVVCDDDGVRSWALDQRATVIWTPGCGLNGAVTEGVAVLARQGFSEVIVTHADLPLATSLSSLAGFDGFTLVPDRHEDGTNVIVVRPGTSFTFSYGPGSFARHHESAVGTGLPVRIVERPDLAWDVDLPADLSYTPA